MAKQNQKSKTIKTRNQKKTKNKKWQDPTLCHYSPPWGVQSCFLEGALVFLVSYFLVRCCFFLQSLTRPKTNKTRNQNNTKPKKQKIQIYIYIYTHHIIYDLFWYLQSEHLEASYLYMPQEIDRAIKRCHLKSFALNYKNFTVYYLFL